MNRADGAGQSAATSAPFCIDRVREKTIADQSQRRCSARCRFRGICIRRAKRSACCPRVASRHVTPYRCIVAKPTCRTILLPIRSFISRMMDDSPLLRLGGELDLPCSWQLLVVARCIRNAVKERSLNARIRGILSTTLLSSAF